MFQPAVAREILRHLYHKAVLFQQRSVFPDGREIPQVLRLIASLAEHAFRGRHDVRNIALAAHLQHQTTARFQRPRHALNRSLRFADPMQGGIGEHGIEGGFHMEIARIGQLKFQLRKILPGLRDHGKRSIQAHHLRAAFRNLRGQMPGAGTHVQHPFAWLWSQHVQQRRARLPHERMPVIVERTVPTVFGCRH